MTNTNAVKLLVQLLNSLSTKDDIKDIRDDIKQHDKRVAGVEVEINNVEKRLDGMEKKLGNVEKRLDSVEKKVDKNTVMLKDMGDTWHDSLKRLVDQEEFEVERKRTDRIEEHLGLAAV